MHRHISRQLLSTGLRSSTRLSTRYTSIRCLQTNADRYQDRLQQRAKEAGVSLDELKKQAKQVSQEQIAAERKVLEQTLPAHKLKQEADAETGGSPETAKSKALDAKVKERKDSSPVKPLSTIFNVEKLMETPHTPEQIGALWTTYHASRSGGTGRGYVCASVPSDMYAKMEKVGQEYSAFVVPVARPRPADAGPLQEGENDTAYEFFFMEWAFHERPPVPTAENDPFKVPSSEKSTNPPTATVIFTPLQEYKLRQSFSTPYLIVTFYTDMVSTHQRVLMRGEITPAGAADRFLLSQEDAQMLVMALQKFYLWNGSDLGESDAAKLLRTFHTKPEDFRWEDLVKVGNLTF